MVHRYFGSGSLATPRLSVSLQAPSPSAHDAVAPPKFFEGAKLAFPIRVLASRKETSHMAKFTTKALLLLSLLITSIALLPGAARAQVPGPHPAYLHALSDLRMARAYLSEGWQWEPVRHDDDHAVAEIDAAIREIKHAAIDDGKQLGDHPPIDVHLGWQDRFARAKELLRKTYHDLDQAEDVPEARGLRNRALQHVIEANNTVDHAWRTARWQ